MPLSSRDKLTPTGLATISCRPQRLAAVVVVVSSLMKLFLIRLSPLDVEKSAANGDCKHQQQQQQLWAQPHRLQQQRRSVQSASDVASTHVGEWRKKGVARSSQSLSLPAAPSYSNCPLNWAEPTQRSRIDFRVCKYCMSEGGGVDPHTTCLR